MNIDINTFAKWCGADYSGAAASICGVSIDSRKVAPGEVFFAFKGERVDGELYVADALAKGAVCAVVSTEYAGAEKNIIVVPDVLKALQLAARAYRKLFDVRIVAITGSVGKTSTKDMLSAVLKQRYNALATEGNYNNEIGLPLMIFKLTEQHDVAVLEMGMNHYGELTTLSEIADQDIAVITNIGTAHIEFFGSKENIGRAKMEITKSLKNGDALVLNGRDEILQKHSSSVYSVHFVGRPEDWLRAANVTVDMSGTTFDLLYGASRTVIKMPLYGEHFVENALLVIRVALLLEMDIEQIAAGLKTVKPAKMRFQFEEIAGRTFINDAYNASVDSIESSVATFCQLPFKRHFAIIGDIFECGDYAPAVHREIGELLNRYSLEGVIFVGRDIAYAAELYRGAHRLCSKADALQNMVYAAGDGVLVKASRGMALETLIDGYRGKDDE